ncbi:MAG: glycosyltransferase family 39 protein [Chloroflexi bacterium]|nr:glycosyltransferase family 39 protein [Chloroflexota bacterium]
MKGKAERWQWALLTVILLLAAVLRFYRLGAQSLWNDEGTTIALAQRDIPTILRNAAADIHPPFYYLVLHYWVRLAGISEFAARALSALAGCALVLVVYILGRVLLHRDAAVLAALYTALSPLQVYYSQETRMYEWAALLGAASWLAFIKLTEADKPSPLKHWHWGMAIGYLALSIGAVYSHYVTFAVIFAQSCAVLALWLAQGKERSWGWILRWLGMQALLVAAYIPWLLVSWRSLTNWPAAGEALSAWQLFARAGQVLAFGITIPLSQLVVILGIVMLSLAVILPLIRRQRSWIYTLYLAVPLVIFYILSLSRPFLKDKFLLLVHPAFALLLASATIEIGQLTYGLLRKRWVAWALTALVLGLALSTSLVSLAHLYYDPAFYRDDYRGIVAEIQRTAGANDAILINAPSQVETVGYYFHGPQQLVPLPLTRPLNQEIVLGQLEELVAAHKRIYGILWATDESDPGRFIETWLDQHTYKALDRWYGDLRLVMYAVPSEVSSQPQVSTDLAFGDAILLEGYTLTTPRVKPGDVVQVALYWRAAAAIPERYKVFIHLLDENGQIVAQRDSEPGGGAALTTTWQPGADIIDRYGILLPDTAQAGELTLRIGLYKLEGGERLHISKNGQELGDYIDLASLNVPN